MKTDTIEIDFSPLDYLHRVYKTWWVVALAILLGGVAGWVFHLWLPPVYESKVVFTINIDFTQTGTLTEKELDHFQWGIGGFIFSDFVAEQVITQAQANGTEIDLPTLREIASLERRHARWEIHIRGEDPEFTASLVNLWGEIARTNLEIARKNALEAQAYQQYLGILQKCQESPLEATCEEWQVEDVPAEIARVSTLAESTFQASHGLPTTLIFDLSETAQIPRSPTLYQRNLLVLMGGLIGFLLSVWVVSSPLGWRLVKRST